MEDEDRPANVLDLKLHSDGSFRQSRQTPVVPTVPTRTKADVPDRASTKPNPLLEALKAQGVSRTGLIQRLVKIAEHGEKVVTKEKRGVIVERTITRDPALQMKAIGHLNDLLDRADGVVSEETATYTKKTYR